jgi:hypothetical protein
VSLAVSDATLVQCAQQHTLLSVDLRGTCAS